MALCTFYKQILSLAHRFFMVFPPDTSANGSPGNCWYISFVYMLLGCLLDSKWWLSKRRFFALVDERLCGHWCEQMVPNRIPQSSYFQGGSLSGFNCEVALVSCPSTFLGSLPCLGCDGDEHVIVNLRQEAVGIHPTSVRAQM